MRPETTVKSKIRNYRNNYAKLVSNLEFNYFDVFLQNYIPFLTNDTNIYINKLLYKSKLIDKSLFNKLEGMNISVLELALTTKFELSDLLEIDLWDAMSLNLIAQFHYSNIFNGLIIYYAHSIDNYVESIEINELKLIKQYFPFAKIINPAQFEADWRRNNCSSKQIMKECLIIVSESDLVAFSALNDSYVSRGVFEEINQAANLNIRTYLINSNKLNDFTLGESNEKDWKNFCPYKPVSLIQNRLDQKTTNYPLSEFFEIYFEEIKRNLSIGKKYIIICNYTKQIEIIIKNLVSFENNDLKILPIIGKSSLCKSEHVNEKCESEDTYEENKSIDFLNKLRENIKNFRNIDLIKAIKDSTPDRTCPYSMLYRSVDEANIILINKIFFQSIRLRTNLRKKIIFNDPSKFILIFDNIFDLFNDHIESKCSNEDLDEALVVLRENDNEDNKKASLIIKNLLELKIGCKIRVDSFLTDFLVKRYESKTHENILENIYNICKTPIGDWIKNEYGIQQIIESDSLKNFLKRFCKIYYLQSKTNKWNFGDKKSV